MSTTVMAATTLDQQDEQGTERAFLDVPLDSLPLRPSVLQQCHRSGYYNLSEIETAYEYGELTASLGVVSQEGVMREIRQCYEETTCGGKRRSHERMDSADGGAKDEEASVNYVSEGVANTPGSGRMRGNRPVVTPGTCPAKDHTDRNGLNTVNTEPAPRSLGLALSIPTAGQILERQSKDSDGDQNHIITFCRSLDQILGGGIPLESLTEMAGPPGCGKTQMAMQLCVDACLPETVGGVQGQAIYIDTEGSFSPVRCLDMAVALVKHVKHTVRRDPIATAQIENDPLFTPAGILERIHVIRIHDIASQLAAIDGLPKIIERLRRKQQQGRDAQPFRPVRLVVIDTMAFHFRCVPTGTRNKDREFYRRRTNTLMNAASTLNNFARTHRAAVVVVNHMTTKFIGAKLSTSDMISSAMNGGGGSYPKIPALGESWAHAVTTRLLLGFGGETGGHHRRTCTLQKSTNRATGTVSFEISEIGVREYVSAEYSNANGQIGPPPSKRNRCD